MFNLNRRPGDPGPTKAIAGAAGQWNPQMTENFAELFEQSLANQRIRPGTILTGRVVFRTDDSSNAKVGMSFPYEVKDGAGVGVVRVDRVANGLVEATFTIQGASDIDLQPPTIAWPYDFPGTAPDPTFRSR